MTREKKTSFLTDVSASNLLQGVITHREKQSDMTPLQREMSDLLSQSQPDLGKLRHKKKQRSSHDTSAKSISRLGSKKSQKSSSKTKSPLSKSQVSRRHRRL